MAIVEEGGQEGSEANNNSEATTSTAASSVEADNKRKAGNSDESGYLSEKGRNSIEINRFFNRIFNFVPIVLLDNLQFFTLVHFVR